MRARLRQVTGALRILGRRAIQAGLPGLQVWTATGEQVTSAVRTEVTALAHKNEVTELDWAARLRRILKDRKVDEAEAAELMAAPAALTRCAERSHDIGETVQ